MCKDIVESPNDLPEDSSLPSYTFPYKLEELEACEPKLLLILQLLDEDGCEHPLDIDNTLLLTPESRGELHTSNTSPSMCLNDGRDTTSRLAAAIRESCPETKQQTHQQVLVEACDRAYYDITFGNLRHLEWLCIVEMVKQAKLWSRADSLRVEKSTDDRDGDKSEVDCSDSDFDTGMYTYVTGIDTGTTHECVGSQCLASVVVSCHVAGIYECSNKDCRDKKERLRAFAPLSEWSSFNDFVLTILGCWTPSFLLILLRCFLSTPQFYPWENATLRIPTFPCLDIHGAMTLLLWATRLVFGPNLNPETYLSAEEADNLTFLTALFKDDYAKASTTLKSLSGPELKITKILQAARTRNICPSRICGVPHASPHGTVDIVHIGQLALKFPLGAHTQLSDHSRCTAQLCFPSSGDSTRVKQAHKCGSGNCTRLHFPVDQLEALYKTSDKHTWHQTAWNISSGTGNRQFSLPKSKVMAISHVWSDGTGVGVQDAGHVNECLFQFFADKATELGCNGIWWDAICIPVEKEARMKALTMMLDNFENAAFTIVHDHQLMSFEWNDDGSPLIALILSAWFSRGWTAAELYASRGHEVKVLFKDPNGPGTVLKDLDEDILALDPSIQSTHESLNLEALTSIIIHGGDKEQAEAIEAIITSRGRRMLQSSRNPPNIGVQVASNLLRRLRPPSNQTTGAQNPSIKHQKVENLLKILDNRTTSWPADRLVIAGLLCLPSSDFDAAAPAPTISQQILQKLGHIRLKHLLHSAMPVAPWGPWSWCPPSIHDLGKAQCAQQVGGDEYEYSTWLGHHERSIYATVNANGTVRGHFAAVKLHPDHNVVPFSPHVYFKALFSEASRKWWTCLLLKPPRCEDSNTEHILASVVVLEEQSVLQPPPEHDFRILDRLKHFQEYKLSCTWICCVNVTTDSHKDKHFFADVVFGKDANGTGTGPLDSVDISGFESR